MKHKREITIYDIANELNVSPSTVSRALKDHDSIGEATKEAVKKLALKRGYRPNSIAASLRSSKTNIIGIITPRINRHFISSLVSGVEEYANASGYNVIISQSHDCYQSEVACANALYASRVGGLIVSLAMETNQYDHFDQFVKNGIPVVFVDRVAEEFNSDRVIIDNFSAGFEATKHLIEQRCKRIAHIAGSQQRNVYRERQKGYIEALKRFNLPVDESLILTTDQVSSEEGLKATKNLLDRDDPPDGIFSANDTTAVSAIQYIKEKGIKIPDEIAVIGFNNDPISLIIDPPLSTISHPAVEMGKIAAKQVLANNQDKENFEPETIILKTQLIVRASSLRKG